MHPELNKRLKLIMAMLSVALLASCASAPTHYPADVEARDILVSKDVSSHEQDEPSTPVENRFDDQVLQAEELNSNRAEYYRRQSQIKGNRTAQINAVLSAAEYYIQAQNFLDAERSVYPLYTDRLTQIQADRLTVINAYVAYSKGVHAQVISLLRPLWNRQPVDNLRQQENNRPQDSVESETTTEESELPTIPERPKLSIQQVDALLLGSFSFQALGDYDSAINALITRERSLVGSTRSETTRYIWQVISSIPVQQRQLIFDSTQNLLVRNRIEQSLSTRIAPVATPPQQFAQWREEPQSIAKQAIAEAWDADSPRSIAVLLPISSRFGKAAQAVKDGINYQHSNNQSSYRPQLRFYDIGDNPYAATQYYAAALQSGADFIIGPLGKDYANQVSNYNGDDHYQGGRYQSRQASTLLLGGDTPLNASTSRFTMSPEMEGARVAERAWRDGHLSAGLLVTDTASSRRTVDAFTRKWQSLGGKVSKTITYSPKQYDHSVELKQLFDINQSQYRHSKISQTLGFKPKFSAYQRSDIDFIFMIANTETGRLIRPQVNFFSGSKVPVYSTSSIFNGIQDKVNNFDLDGTHFPVMPWVLKSAKVAPYAGQLNMLFALGTDAYSVAASYRELRQNSDLAINGNTGQVSISNYGETMYQPVWASFRQGEVVPIETLGLDINPLNTPNGGVLDNQTLNGTYNDSIYNSQTWDQQSGGRRKSQQENSQDQNGEDDLRRSR